MRDRFYQFRRFVDEHQPEIAFGLMTLSIGFAIKGEIQWKMMRHDTYVYVTSDELMALVRNDVSTVSYEVAKRNYIHLMKMTTPIERTSP